MWKVKLVGALLSLFIIGTVIFLVLDPGGDIYNQYLSLGGSSKSGFESKKEFNYQAGIKENKEEKNNQNSSAVSNQSADTKKVIEMDDTTFWQLISDNRFNSYDEATAAWKASESNEKAYWNSMVVDIAVPCWKFSGDYKNGDYTKVESTVNITVNKNMAAYFTDFMTDLYNLPEKYVIMSVGGFVPRIKNNPDGSQAGLSAHTFGTTLDINAWYDGMGSAGAGERLYGTPFNTSNGLDEFRASTCCTYDNSWFQLAKEYNLNWGGLWSPKYLDPMHFSVVGDGSLKNQVNYTPKTPGKAPSEAAPNIMESGH